MYNFVMNSFSILPYDNQTILDTYKQWLVSDLYRDFNVESIEDPIFLQKLSIIQAEAVRHDIELYTTVTHDGIKDTSAQIGRKMQAAASLIASSIDDGFLLMNKQMWEINDNLCGINHNICEVNHTLQQGNSLLADVRTGIGQMNRGIMQLNHGINAVASVLDIVNRNVVNGIAVLKQNIAQATCVLQYQLQQANSVLQQILDELKIPESQRERRYHIEEGIKFFNKGMQSGDCLYFDDAIDEFNTAISIERKDFFSWYYLGMIYLYSKNHVNLDKSVSAFDTYIHYADALSHRHYLFDEALLMKAECKYLQNDTDSAYALVQRLIATNDKAALRAVKYLSASSDTYRQQQAVEVLSRQLQKNPTMVMQVLEDIDMIKNTYLMRFLHDYREILRQEVSRNLSAFEQDLCEIKTYKSEYNRIKKDILSPVKKELLQDDVSIMDLLAKKNSIQDAICELQIMKIEHDEKKLYPYEGISGKYGYRHRYIYHDIIPCQWANAMYFSEGLAAVCDEMGNWGFVNNWGEVVIPMQWTGAYKFAEGLSCVRNKDGKYGVIDKSNKLVVPCKWDSISEFVDGRARACRNGVDCLIDKRGRVVFQCVEEHISHFHVGMIVLLKNSKYGIVDNKGDWITFPCWNSINLMGGVMGLAVVKGLNGKYGIINKLGSLVSQCQWEEVSVNRDGMIVVKDSNGKYGIMNDRGILIVPCKWESIIPLLCNEDGLVAVRGLNGKWGFVDLDGNLVLPCLWRYCIEGFKNGTAIVCRDYDYVDVLIDKSGEVLMSAPKGAKMFRYDNIVVVYDNFTHPERYTYYDNHGNIIGNGSRNL